MLITGVIHANLDFGKKIYITNIFMYLVNNEKLYLFIIVILIHS